LFFIQLEYIPTVPLNNQVCLMKKHYKFITIYRNPDFFL